MFNKLNLLVNDIYFNTVIKLKIDIKEAILNIITQIIIKKIQILLLFCHIDKYFIINNFKVLFIKNLSRNLKSEFIKTIFAKKIINNINNK